MSLDLSSFVDHSTVKVSSVLLRDFKSYGKQHIFDGKDETCWNSDAGTKQALIFALKTSSEELSGTFRITQFDVTFQGGFVPKSIDISISVNSNPITEFRVTPLDSNAKQSFNIPEGTEIFIGSPHEQQISIRMDMKEGSSDFYGRIVIYDLKLVGSQIN